MKRVLHLDIILFVLLLQLGIYHVKGECLHNGRTYLKHTVWQPGPCTVCTCEDPIVLCETIRCTDPLCEYAKGEHLQISADSCCPECVANKSACTYQQQSIPHNTEWNPELCMKCKCTDGEVNCAKLPCPVHRCRTGEIRQTLPGHCCPQCIPAGRSCMYNGEQHQDGSYWDILPCTTCTCTDGQHQCYPIHCPPVVCSEDEVLETADGSCCPQCQGHDSTCHEGALEYKTGEQWNRNTCTVCVCIGGTVVCTLKECMDQVICNHGYREVTRPGECCSECVPTTDVCTGRDGVSRYRGDLWNISTCQYCICDDTANVQCHTAICDNIVCFKEEILVHLPGTCCPRCMIPPSCELAGQVHMDGERWMSDACTLCHCDAGVTQCYTQHCSQCPTGTRMVSVPGECCGTCQKVDCSPECADCEINAPNNCTVCSNTQLYVQDGRCLHTCRMGFYPSLNATCLPCHDTCYTCTEGTEYHCDMCQPGLMWKHGQCVTQCGLGYYLQNGRCLECSTTCKSCNGPGDDQCVSCATAGQVVYQGMCLDQCPDNFFIRKGKCKACHPTCKTCTPDGVSCASCWQGGLLHLGQCVTRCSVGYYSNTVGSCSSCHPACESCNGGSSKNCTSCYPGYRVNKKGRCRNLCSKGQYMSSQGMCKDCEVGCTECHQSWQDEGSVCSGCESRDHVIAGNQCVHKCPSGFYQEHRACKACGENCASCTSSAGCSKCSNHKLLYEAQCVDQCAQGQFEDGPSLSCKDCSPHCLRCYSEEDCSLCDSTTFLKHGRCMEQCGDGFIANAHKRECQRNTGAPTFKVLNQVEVNVGEVTTIDLSLFYISDADTDLEDLLVTITTLPSNGDLVKVTEGRDMKVKVGSNVTVKDIMDGKFRFALSPGTTYRDFATLKVSDTQLTSQPGKLYFQAVQTDAITIATSSLLIATAGAETVITSAVLDLNVQAEPSDVKITVLQGPRAGNLYNSDIGSKPARVFSLSDLRSGVMVYGHTGQQGAAEGDSVLLQATDGFHVSTFLLNVEIRETENNGPVLMRNKVGHVVLGDMMKISPDLLLARVIDTPASPTEEVVYTLVPPLNNPESGEIIMVVPIPPAGVGNGWVDMGDGNMGTRMTRFLQRDIDEGRIWYKNRGSAALTDIIKFEVTDTGHATAVLTDQMFKITVRKKTNPGPVTHPTLIDGVKLRIRVLENQVVPITSSNLAFQDQNTDAAGIQYSVTRPLEPNAGRLEHVERPSQKVVNFTQEDVDSNRIVYKAPDSELGYREKKVFFYFIVSDDQVDVPVQEHKFTITLVPVNNQPPRFLSPIPLLHVSQGGSIPIGQPVIDIFDEDTPLTDLFVTLTRAPHNGKLEKVEDGAKRSIITQGEEFTYFDMEQNVFQYTHDGSVALYDTMQITVSDDLHMTSTSIDIKVMRMQQAAPRLKLTASCRLIVTEGTSKVISKDILAFTDSDDPDNSLTLMLTMTTKYGKLLLSNQEVHKKDTFTQGDIDEDRLSYLVDTEMGMSPVTESLTFNVSDSTGNVLPEQTLTILIEPDNNLAPEVKVNSNLRVNEGGSVALTSDLIGITDLDTPLSDLVIVIETQPSFGFLKDISPENDLNGESSEEDRLVATFTVEDLEHGYIKYVQSDHKGKEVTKDSFTISVKDGKNQSPPSHIDINIKPIDDESPVIVTEQVFVQEGHSVVVTNTSIYITDLDTQAANLLITVITPPEHGILRLKTDSKQPVEDSKTLANQARFTYMDVLTELLIYVHDGSEVTVDSFSVYVTDGRASVQGRVPIIVGLINDEAPRVTINTGLRVYPGTTTVIQQTNLQATDVDSHGTQLVYTVSRDPRIGRLYIRNGGRQLPVTSQGPVSTFLQEDIDKGRVEYRHNRGETTGNVMFMFTVADAEGNQLTDQDFYITILDDRSPPREVTNKELICEEGGKVLITTDYLSFTDDDSETLSLMYILIETPKLGQVELVRNPGVTVIDFSQKDLVDNNVVYVHTSTAESHADSFTFSVTDGINEVEKTFSINISPVDDSIPVVTSKGLRVQEGIRKLITEFDLKAVDKDTMEDSLIFTVTTPPVHGNIERLTDKEQWQPVSTFSMTQIYENQISYNHDGGDTTQDSFKFTMTDGSNNRFTMINVGHTGQFTVPQTQSQEFHIEVMAMDDGSPVIEANVGLQFLEVLGSNAEAGNIITSHELRAVDEDTSPDKLKYVVRELPRYGRLEKTSNPGVDLLSFTQEDINNSIVRYILTNPGSVYEDSFTFDLYDSRPRRIPGNSFYITWSSVEFEHTLMNVTETSGLIELPVIRRGNLKQYCLLTCHTLSGTATSSEQGTRPGQQDFVQHMGQVQFDEWQDRKTCTIIINDDSIFEGRETFYVELLQPVFTLLGTNMKTTITINDMEDEPVLQFQKSEYHVGEGDSYLSANIQRSGDISSTVSAICFTSSLTARGSPLDRLDSGSDYISRGNSNSYRVIFPSGVSIATCDVKLIDDSLNEASEQFELELTLPSYGAKLGPISQATVIIDGPNDESQVHFSQEAYLFNENEGIVDVEIIREGTDLTHTTTIWCATRLSNPPSASAGSDYVPSSSQITFGPGQTSQMCHLTILDDDADPHVEGDEAFIVFLSSAVSSNLIQPYTATIHIHDDMLDLPTMSFPEVSYTVDESAQQLNVPIYRSGDITFESSVICYTRQDSALVMVDYVERALTEQARIIFNPGEKVQNCTIEIVNDDIYETDETFQLRLARPVGSDKFDAKLGQYNSTVIVITNKDDIPKLQFEKAAYSIPEPSVKDQITMVTLKVVRTGDVSMAANVKCSTRDGSAMSGTDYNPKSQVLQFAEGVRIVDFTIDILYNSDIEWHETFSVILGPDEPVGAQLGSVSMATITILDNDVAGSMVLPAPPLVISLLKLDDVESGMKLDPSPGYPLVCITPCDSRHPSYASTTRRLCTEAKINESAIYYRWEVAIPDMLGARAPFMEISYSTVFTSVNHMVLDSIYFRPSFKIRCIAQAIDDTGNLGIPLKSTPVTIGRDNGICKSPVFSGLPFSYQAQSFHAKLDYVGTEDAVHPNTIHISVKVPHQDGMLPLISTFPISNLKHTLSEPVYRQQHICSNIITPLERSALLNSGFLGNNSTRPMQSSPGFDFPYQFTSGVREDRTLMLYKYLDLKKCMWTFEAWYHMTDLVDLCGGRAVSDFQVKGGGQTYLTVRMPLYVSYLYAVAPIGWGSLEHRTELEFSFYYDTVLWRSGLETKGELGGRLQVMRILIADDGKLVVDFKTQAKFRGVYVLKHDTLPGYTSRFFSEKNDITFDLDLVWGQNTYDGPHQLWRATSLYSFKDYTGEYVVELIPCTVESHQGYTITTPPACSAHQPLRFDVPIAFQQTNRPVSLEYTLNTHFQISNNEQMFLTNPYTGQNSLQNIDSDAYLTFSRGDHIYGRVLWSPEQDLEDAYTLALEKVFICAGRDGHVPTYDPTGTVYNSGPQYGCMQPGPDLKYRFLILDRMAPHTTSRSFQGVGFDAQFASENTLYSSLVSIRGVDGFVISVDPLYKVTSGLQWYLQVIYSIGPTDIVFRKRRSAMLSLANNRKRSTEENVNMKYDWLKNNVSKNGTNIKVLNLNNTHIETFINNSSSTSLVAIILPIVLSVIVIIVCCIVLILRKRRKKYQRYTAQPPRKRNNLELANQNSVIYKGKASGAPTVRCTASLDLKHSVVYKGDYGKTAVRVKDTNIQTNKNISKGNGTEV